MTAAESPAGDGRPFDALLLDYGGVVSRSTFELLPQLAGRHPQVAGALRRRGPLGAEHDELWDRMMAREISEREYWSRLAAQFRLTARFRLGTARGLRARRRVGTRGRWTRCCSTTAGW